MRDPKELLGEEQKVLDNSRFAIYSKEKGILLCIDRQGTDKPTAVWSSDEEAKTRKGAKTFADADEVAEYVTGSAISTGFSLVQVYPSLPTNVASPADFRQMGLPSWETE